MPLSVTGSNLVSFGNTAASKDDRRRERVGEAAAVTGAAGAGYSATRGATFKMFNSSSKAARGINTLANSARAVNQPIRESNSLWNAFKVNYRQLSSDIAKWAQKSNMPNFMKAMFTGKLGAFCGGVGALFVFVTGVSEVISTFSEKVSHLTNS